MHAQPRSIQFAIGSLNLGGSESQLVTLAAGLARRGWTVDVFTLENQAARSLSDRLLAAGATWSPGPYVSGAGSKARKVLSLLDCERRLHAQIRRNKPTVVHGFLPLTNVMAAVAGRLARAPLVVTSRRALGTHQDRTPAFKRLDHIANAMSHVVTANSRAVAEDVARRDGYAVDKIAIIPNGLDFERFASAAANRETMPNIVLRRPMC